ncbi:DUF2062 domain-containing protein [Myxococcota bacterium]|nr:DUF2062 domain-containing protein [Myxococcota bacterium]
MRGPAEAFRLLLHHLAHDHTEPSRLAAAVAVGTFLGATPFYGFHVALCVVAALALRLNVLVTYLAANVSNPVFAPFLVVAELHVGSWLLHGRLAPWTVAELRERLGADPTGTLRGLADTVLGPLLLGSAVVGAGLGAAGGLLTWDVARRARARRALHRESGISPVPPGGDPALDAALGRVAELALTLPPPPGAGRFARRYEREFVRRKLGYDPIFRTLPPLIPDGADVCDVGCGRGLLLAVLAARGHRGALRGFDWDDARLGTARHLSGGRGDVALARADARSAPIPEADVIVLVDLLHYLAPQEQDAVLEAAILRLRPGGRLLLRDMDVSPGAGWRGGLHRLQERLTTSLGVNRGERVAPPGLDAIQARLEARGFAVRSQRIAGWFGSTDRLLVADLPGRDAP